MEKEKLEEIARKAKSALAKIEDTPDRNLSASGVAAHEGLKTSLQNQIDLVEQLKRLDFTDAFGKPIGGIDSGLA